MTATAAFVAVERIDSAAFLVTEAFFAADFAEDFVFPTPASAVLTREVFDAPLAAERATDRTLAAEDLAAEDLVAEDLTLAAVVLAEAALPVVVLAPPRAAVVDFLSERAAVVLAAADAADLALDRVDVAFVMLDLALLAFGADRDAAGFALDFAVDLAAFFVFFVDDIRSALLTRPGLEPGQERRPRYAGRRREPDDSRIRKTVESC